MQNQTITLAMLYLAAAWMAEDELDGPSMIRSDWEENSTIYYKISGKGADEPPYGLFVINEKNGELNITGIVDREKNDMFKLKGKAYNFQGEVEQSLDLRIKVLDVNDNNPVFTQEVFYGAVEEASETNTFVMQLNATDADEKGTPNSQIAYRLLSQHPGHMPQFLIKKDTGKVYTIASNLDREVISTYTIGVEGKDLSGAYNGRSDSSTAEIKILDVNDNFPQLEHDSYEGSVEENTAGVEVLRMKAFDADEEGSDNWLADFQIASGNEGGYFAMKTDAATNEGVLMLVKEVDYETLQNLQLSVAVANKAAFHSSVASSYKAKAIPVKINVKNKKEGASFSPRKKALSVREELAKKDLPKRLGKYAAVDRDTGKIADNVKYAKEYDPDNWFSVDPKTAEITLNKVPDRESPNLVNGVYTAKILAITDDFPAHTATGTIELNVEDVNDHCPTIVNLAQHTCKNAGRINVTAVDEDADPNAGPFTFYIVDEPKGNADKWEINKKHDTSVLIVSKNPLWSNEYEIEIDVKDRQGLSCTKKQVLKVTVCQCPDGIKCAQNGVVSPLKDAKLGGGVVGLMILGLLTLLLVPLLLMFCQCGQSGFKPIAFTDGGVGTIGIINDEAGPVDTKKLLSPVAIPVNDSYPVPVNEGMIGMGTIETVHGSARPARGSLIGRQYGTDVNSGGFYTNGGSMGWRKSRESLRHVSGSGMAGAGFVTAGAGFVTAGGGALGEAFLDMYLTEKAQNYAEEEDSQPANDCFLIYNDEETSSLGSIGCCSFIEGGQDDHFLDNLEPKFKTLAEICIGKEINMDVQPSESSSVMAIKPVITNTVMTSPALQVTKTVQGPKIQQNVVVTEKSYSTDSGVKAVKFPVNPIAQENVVVTEKSYSTDSGVKAVKFPVNPIAQENVVVTEKSYSTDSGVKAVKFPVNPIAQENVVVTEKSYSTDFGIKTARLPADAVVQNSYVVTEKSTTSGSTLQATRADASSLHQQNVMLNGSVVTSGAGLSGTIKIPDMSGSQNVVVVNRRVVSGSGMNGAILSSDPLLSQSFFTTEQLLTPSAPLTSTTSRVIKYSTVESSE
nr:PREDICTED: desmoglein-2-like [Latimeria chalumnae]|eukprot:XP_006011818.2 PREDICTED: desmoglein-2-like [Latimeria chalumnae]